MLIIIKGCVSLNRLMIHTKKPSASVSMCWSSVEFHQSRLVLKTPENENDSNKSNENNKIDEKRPNSADKTKLQRFKSSNKFIELNYKPNLASSALKDLANLIDKREPNKSADKLMEPFDREFKSGHSIKLTRINIFSILKIHFSFNFIKFFFQMDII